MSHKSEMCAEVLVSERVEARFVMGSYVANQNALSAFQAVEMALPVRIRIISKKPYEDSSSGYSAIEGTDADKHGRLCRLEAQMVASTIRNLGMLRWLDVKPDANLPVTDEEELVEV